MNFKNVFVLNECYHFPFNFSALISKYFSIPNSSFERVENKISWLMRIQMISIHRVFSSAYKYMLMIGIFLMNLIKPGKECSTYKNPA